MTTDAPLARKPARHELFDGARTALTGVQRNRLEQVPIDAILALESEAFGISAGRQALIREAYESYVKGLVNALKKNLWDSKRRDINSLDEVGLFRFASSEFRTATGYFYSRESVVSTAMEGVGFNCYSSSVVLADALIRSGKEMSVIMSPGHIFIAGRMHAFETAGNQEGYTFPILTLGAKYSSTKTGGVEALVRAAATHAITAYRTSERIDEAGRALRIVLLVIVYGSC